jgi:hypothetical protein
VIPYWYHSGIYLRRTAIKEFIRIIRKHVNACLDELESLEGADLGAMSEGGSEMTASAPAAAVTEIPTEWVLIESREDETYSWPTLLEEYVRFDVYEGTSSDGRRTRWAVGECERVGVWGKDRKYYIVFRLGTGGGSKQPICEFLEPDDYNETNELVAIIRGAGGPRGQQMFDPGDDLPSAYEGMRVETYRDRIAGMPDFRGWNKLAVVAREDDVETMLRHAAIQVALRHS